MKINVLFSFFLFIVSYSCSDEIDTSVTRSSNDSLNINRGCATKCLDIINYLNNTQNIHPKVLHFPNKWMGHYFWMAYTPYPNGVVSRENPSIAVSNDGISWYTPKGLINPISSVPVEGYNSDSHLVYREDLNLLELWWRPYNSKNNTVAIVRKISRDGINWGETETIFDYSKDDKLSPAIIFEDNKYKMWYCLSGKVYYVESIENSIKNWSSPIELNINWGILKAWHMDVIHTKKGYEMVVCAYSPTGNNNSADLYYVLEDNDKNCSTPLLILAKSIDKNAIDSRSIYRSSILYINGLYKIYYSCISENWVRSIALTSGKSLSDLNGYGKQ